MKPLAEAFAVEHGCEMEDADTGETLVCRNCTRLAAVVADWLSSDEVVEVVRSAFRGDDYEENAMGAAQEGEWSWFGWLATQQLAALAAHAKGEAL